MIPKAKSLLLGILRGLAAVSLYQSMSLIGETQRYIRTQHFETDIIPENNNPDDNGIGTPYKLAYDESFGYFNDISDSSWRRLQLITRERMESVKRVYKKLKGLGPVTFYEYFEPDFSCAFERRLGNPEIGDGAKWVCDPHRLKRDKCLVYSVGSHGDFSFEESVHKMIGNGNWSCEIHTFDPDPIWGETTPSFVHYHAWGLASSAEAKDLTARTKQSYKSIGETIQELGHEGRMIDLFKIDCEGCEWTSYKDWIDSEQFQIRQLLVELHTEPAPNSGVTGYGFFEDLFAAGYVIYHKEPNMDAFRLTRRPYYEYAFLKLDKAFRGDLILDGGAIGSTTT